MRPTVAITTDDASDTDEGVPFPNTAETRLRTNAAASASSSHGPTLVLPSDRKGKGKARAKEAIKPGAGEIRIPEIVDLSESEGSSGDNQDSEVEDNEEDAKAARTKVPVALFCLSHRTLSASHRLPIVSF